MTKFRMVEVMCGLFGMFGQFPPELVQRAARVADQALYHRGPDHGAHVVGNEALLVSRRLAIMDAASVGHQPMASHDGRHKLAYNGMLYNFRDLRAELQHHYSFRGNSDTEVVAAALTVWGVDALRRFEGMFALLWWDEVNSDLIAAVDPVGIKPLLFSLDLEGNLVCSSELGPLVDLFPQLSVDNDALGTYLSGGLIDHSSRTLIAGIRQLRRGEYLHWSKRGLALKKYRHLIPRTVDSPMSDFALRDLLLKSVDRHAVSDRQLGISLSYGLDSNLIRLLIASNSGKPAVQMFTHSYGTHAHDEFER
ncbi:MAG: asparagine synthetase B family protein, partial [Actinomycetota bacterium]